MRESEEFLTSMGAQRRWTDWEIKSLRQMTRIISNLLMRGHSGNHWYFLIRALREIRGSSSFPYYLLVKNF